MTRFRDEKKSAKALAKKLLEDKEVKSIRSAKHYRYWLAKAIEELGDLRKLSVTDKNEYLANLGERLDQSSINQIRQSLQKAFPNDISLARVESAKATELNSRCYTSRQVELIAKHQSHRNSLATRLAFDAGLRAHELLTVRPSFERSPDTRPTHDDKFLGRETDFTYTVIGKGGLCRDVRICEELALELELLRTAAVKVKDRGIWYESVYHVGGGQSWSQSFSEASDRALGYSSGAHGLRHSYAQIRMNFLTRRMKYIEALEVVSQEMGHFRATITETYLR